ncbi:hypothetical protein PLESTB_001396500 [Pleodorina starrii]|uniref:C-CAP/cofactor C-like domain-containing protein n=1 Tax=Pleodorina starrii TaxID=330485 RepID=A0A9W6BVT5_9CHLO|nr:hypothetical protein PLESTM_000535800 [Pleodorina starrii]GLC58747.1 hypothetical protein PLESTB_001396500 [Pleodorina starrii]GLC75168.1 hypothetical protein PLESTF_001602600 [Pleodorina starrii]
MAPCQVTSSETADSGQAGPVAVESPVNTQCPEDASACSGSAAAASVVLDKLAGLDVARRAERERRREESRAAADPRESVARFLRSFAARQRNIDEALQRLLHSQRQQPCPSPAAAQQPQQQTIQPSPSPSPDPAADSGAPEPVPPLPVSAATPEQVQASLELLSAEVLSLEQAAAAASYYLPAYDQKQCAAAVAALRAAIESARSALAPRRRFAFGSKKVSKVRGEEVSAAAAAPLAAAAAPEAARDASSAAPQTAAAAAAATPAGGAEGNPSTAAAAAASVGGGGAAAVATCSAGDDDAPAALTVSEQDRALVARGRGLMGLTDATVVLSADVVSEGGAGGDFVLLGLTRCRVVLLGRLRALRISGLRSCSVVSGPVTGACFVDDVRGSSLSLATYQVRVHRTHSTSLFLRVRSKPIIEHSTGIRVAPWQAAVAPEPRLGRLLQAHMLGEETGCWQQVDDFGWIKTVQSPNWGVMPPEEYPREPLVVPEAVWEVACVAGCRRGEGGGDDSGGGEGPEVAPKCEDEDEI